MIKVSDYIVKRLEELGIEQAFMVAGGGAMHLDDSLGRSGINYTCCHHEQACAMAAEGYARITGKPAVVVVTSGPGGTNTLTGVIGQWLDSVPCIYISGNVKRETSVRSAECGVRNELRQLGDQEINIIDIVRPVTKVAVAALRPEDIGYHLDQAVYVSMHNRPGPVWLDIPLDVQSAMVDESGLSAWGFYPAHSALRTPHSALADALRSSSRPLLLAGHGIRISGAKDLLLEFAEQTGIPVVTSFNGMDLIPSDHPQYAGRIGTIGTRAGNRALQECDLLISIGSRNNIRQVSYDWKDFAPQAKKVVVDIDQAELDKPTVRPDVAVCADAGDFLKAILEQGDRVAVNWTKKYTDARTDANTVRSVQINPYEFVRVLTELLPDDAVIVSGNGTASIALFQAGVVKKDTRVIMNSGCAAMGYDLPAATGAALGSAECGVRSAEWKPRQVVCITGDGSIQMNIQELQTIAHHWLPIKIFVLNNGGYHSIRQTQDRYFEGRRVGAGPDSGVSCPEMMRIAEAYGIMHTAIINGKDMSGWMKMVLDYHGPALCEVVLTQDYVFDKLDLAAFSATEGSDQRQ